VIESLAGKKLTMSCSSPDKFQYDQMKANLPHLTAAINDVCSVSLILVAGALRTTPAAEPIAPAATPDAATPPPAPVPGNDAFNSLMSRFGGVEVDPSKTREPK
jgi:hypothetical protein